MDDPTGYGRIERRGDQVIGIVEHRDADARQRGIDEVNTSVYAFDAELLTDALDRLGRDNSQGEYYLTDVIAILNADGHRVVGVVTDTVEGTGVNSHAQLAGVSEVLRQRINDRLMADMPEGRRSLPARPCASQCSTGPSSDRRRRLGHSPT
jgi:bifunctional UDP-N-acetylglucosamine pyrophosphorylase/glucosamine-1-phosphate N-acetyltransferase